ncbi:hypothetical protein [Burkholderia cepacia]|uniref:hypothetical protein n=1 Tax=Burkholderia cepacia TaxID=292 RepID=UPI003528AA79
MPVRIRVRVRVVRHEPRIGGRIRLDPGWQAIGEKGIGQRAVDGEHAWRIGIRVRNERAGGTEMRPRDTTDGGQFRHGRERGLKVGRTARGGRRVAGLGDEHTDPHGRVCNGRLPS